MAWTYALIGLAVGIIIGFLISRVTVPGIKHQKTLKQDLEKSKYELEQYRQELVDHFATSATMLEALAKCTTIWHLPQKNSCQIYLSKTILSQLV